MQVGKLDFQKHVLPHLLVLLGFIFITYGYMSPVLEGKKLEQHDITQYKGMAKEVDDFKERTGEISYWTGAMFAGMPTYQITSDYKHHMFILQEVYRLLARTLPSPSNFLFLYLICFYILMMALGINPIIGFIASVAFAFSTNNIIIIEAGHNTKSIAIAFGALVLAGFLILFRNKKFYLFGGALFALALAFQVHANHVQVTYYLFMLLGLYLLIDLGLAIKEKRLPDFSKRTGIFILGTFLALGANTSRLALTYEYTPETMRGGSDLSINKAGEKVKKGGLSKDYALEWSYGVAESGTLLIPNFKGGPSAGPLSTSSNTYQELRRNNVGDAENIIKRMPTYFGPQRFTAGPVYFGAAVFMLFFFALWVVKGRMKWWLLAGSILAVMLAWGKYFMPLTALFFDYLPFYNKFRTVSIILFVAETAVPLLGFWGVHQLLTQKNLDKEDLLKGLKITFGILGGFVFLFVLMPGVFLDFNGKNDGSLPEWLLPSLLEDRAAMVRSDAFRSFIFILLTAALLWAWIKEKIKPMVFYALLAGIIMADLIPVNKRYLSNEKFKPARQTEIRPTPADQAIMQDDDPHYRVLNLSVSPFNDATTSYFHKSIGGYHGAKLGRYQEMIDFYITDEIQNKIRNNKFSELKVLNMLNMKYVIASPEVQGVVQNPDAFGNAWFVKDVKKVANPDEEIMAIADINPREKAVFDEKFADRVSDFSFDAGASIELTDYQPNQLTYRYNASSPQFAVFSEVYYNEQKGWNAYLNGEPIPHLRVNYILRGMNLPEGEHELVFKFEPETLPKAETVSLVASLLLLVGFVGISGWSLKHYQPPLEPFEINVPQPSQKDSRKRRAPKGSIPRRKRK